MIYLKLDQAQSREQLHAYLKEKLGLPGYYGANLDALYDVLTDINEEFHVCIEGVEDCDMKLNGYGKLVLRVFRDAQKVTEGLKVYVPLV